MKFFYKISYLFIVGITMAILLGMLYFGIRFKGYRPVNNVHWTVDDQVLSFNRFGIAYTDDFFSSHNDIVEKNAGLTIVLRFRCDDMAHYLFRYLLIVSDGDDRSQLLIGQYSDSLIIMNGNDHDGNLGLKKIDVDIGYDRTEMKLLTIISDETGTNVYLDGKLAGRKTDLHLYYPERGEGRTRLILGNSTHGDAPFLGVIAELALFDTAIKDLEVIAGFGLRAGDESHISSKVPVPEIWYRFSNSPNGQVQNLASDAYPLKVPMHMTILKKVFLSWPQLHPLDLNMKTDMVINLIGFMPLGFFLWSTFLGFKGFIYNHKWLMSVVIAFAFSLSLEIFQAWIPSRTSSLLDLILNTVGAGAGAWFALVSCKIAKTGCDIIGRGYGHNNQVQ